MGIWLIGGGWRGRRAFAAGARGTEDPMSTVLLRPRPAQHAQYR